MLKGVSKLVSPDLLKVLAEMGHGDEIIFSDAHFPAYSLGLQVIRADGLSADSLLDGVLPLIEIDAYADDHAVMMAAVPGDTLDVKLVEAYEGILKKHSKTFKKITYIERFAFYERAKNAMAVVVTGETRKYGNIIIKKGVITE